MNPAKLIAVFMLALFAVACGNHFDDPNQILDRRILAIKVDKPQLIKTNVAPGDVLKLDALIVEPSTIVGAPSFTVDYEWGYCLIAPTSSAFPGGGGNRPGAENQTSILCTDAKYQKMSSGNYTGVMPLHYEMPIPLDLIAALQASGEAPVAEIRVQLRVDDGKGGWLYSVKTIAVSSTDTIANKNPALTALVIDAVVSTSFSGDAETYDLPNSYNICDDAKRITVENDQGQRVSVCHRIIAPEVQAGDMESYLERNSLTGEIETRTERYQFAWYCDLGSFDNDTTTQPDPRRSLPYTQGVGNRWLEPTSPPDTTKPFHIWVVVRDDRGGIDWETRTLRFAP